MVKLLNIKLNVEDENPLITVDVQEKVMDDVMVGIETVIGRRQKHHGCLRKAAKKVDKALANMLTLQENSRHQLTRTFEKIVLDEHFTNLYAPRILAKDAAVEQTDSDNTDKVRGVAIDF